MLHISPVMLDKTKCVACGGKKRFRKNKTRCLACSRQNTKNKQRRIIALRNEVFDLMGGECEDCHTRDRRVFTIDHANNDGKKHRKDAVENVMGRWRLYYEAIVLKSHRLRLLCSNCHMIRDLKREI